MTDNTKVPVKGLQDFVAKLREAAGDNLVSVVLYGSAVSGGFDQYSDLNLLCVLRDLSYPALERLSPAITWWSKQKQRMPLLTTPGELERCTDVFAIEFLDMKANYQVLHGEDVLRDLQVPTQLLRAELEYELREKLILLRQHLLAAGGDDGKMWHLLVRSLPSFTTLFRHTLMVAGQPVPVGKRESVEAAAKLVGFDPGGFLQVLDIRERNADPRKLNLRDTAVHYLAAVEQVTAAVDRMLDSPS
jgi:hypothetical protein